jgi:hypothetical protein
VPTIPETVPATSPTTRMNRRFKTSGLRECRGR